MKYLIQIDLIIECGDTDPHALTGKLGTEPTCAQRRGERNPALDVPRMNYWSRRSTAPDRDASLAIHWASLGPLFADKEDIIREAGARGRNRLAVFVDATGRAPSVIIPLTMARFVTLINGEIDVDICQ